MKVLLALILAFLSSAPKAEDCLELFQKLDADIPSSSVKLMELPEKARRLIEESRERVMGIPLPRNRDGERLMLSSIGSQQMRRGLQGAIDRLYDRAFLSDYISKLEAETFQEMMKEGGELAGKARAGVLERDILEKVLKERAKKKGALVIELREFKNNREFNRAIGRGYIIDFFSDSSNHGMYTHFLQQDMLYDVIAKSAGLPHSDVMKFFGTEEGLTVWEFLMDGRTGPMSPEFFKPNIMSPNLPLP